MNVLVVGYCDGTSNSFDAEVDPKDYGTGLIIPEKDFKKFIVKFTEHFYPTGMLVIASIENTPTVIGFDHSCDNDFPIQPGEIE